MKNNRKTECVSSVLAILCCGVMSQGHAALADNAILDFADGVVTCVRLSDPSTATGCEYDLTSTSGSYFGVDFSGDEAIEDAEKVALLSAGVGITLGNGQAVGEIDQASTVGGSDWVHFTSQGLSLISSSGNTAILDMTGWNVSWNGGNIPWGTGSYATITCDVDCSSGESFTLDYSAANPNSGAIYGLYYELYLEGVIASAVPVPAAAWLFASGLMGLVGFSRRHHR